MAAVMLLILFLLLLYYFALIPFDPDPLIFFTFIPMMQAIPLIWYFHRKAILQFVFPSKPDIKSFLNFSFIVFITNTIQFLAYRIDYWVLIYFYSTTELGIYAQANRFAQLQWVIPNVAASLIIPAIAATKPRLTDTGFLTLVKLIFISGIIIAILLYMIAYLLFAYFLPIDFSPGLRALVLMLPGFYFFTLNILFAAWFAAQRKLWVNLNGSLICLVSIFIADLILIPKYSFNGAAIGNSIAYSLAAFYSLYMFLKLSSFNWKDLLQMPFYDWKKILKNYGG
jgi:O-antigen/teichoic acid export membrane protein